jgi:hypothetical protein
MSSNITESYLGRDGRSENSEVNNFVESRQEERRRRN